MTKRVAVHCLLLALAACGGRENELPTENDPVIGTWVLNIAKSSFGGGIPDITSQTVTYAPGPSGITATTETVTRSGAVLQTTYTAAYDGKRYPISGSPNADSISFARLDARTVERFDTKGPTFVGSLTRIVAADGKTLTVMSKPVGAGGRTVGSILVYDRK
ncbi:MAG: hypothetical protein ACT4P6_13470 [Gemmatimonadaceae bacterium]